jgi:hypothetical protein
MPTGVPLSPDEARKGQTDSIPDFVINAFNELLIKNLSTGNPARSTVSQSEVSDLICKSLKENEKIKLQWLNIESLYEKKGWFVHYVKDEGSNNRSYFSFKEKIQYDL